MTLYDSMSRELAEVARRVGGVARPAARTAEEEPPALVARGRQDPHERLDVGVVHPLENHA